MMPIQVISRESIKPSSPTPSLQNTFKLSVIDKVAPRSYIKLMSYYSPAQTKNVQNLDQTLKNSLSEALTIFYPFAGRANDDFTIDCNDNGVLFVTASVDCELVGLLQTPKPKIESFEQFRPPLPPLCPGESCRPSLLAFQLNKFSCGGIAVSFCFCHLLIDAITNATFLKCWSEIAANVEGATNYTICPAVSMYPQGSIKEAPPKNISGLEESLSADGPISQGNTRRFNFASSALTKIKENSVSEHVPSPTRVEALTSFIWKHLMLASEEVRGYKQPSSLTQAVDLRRRMPLQILPSMLPVGNLVWVTVAHYRQITDETKIAEKNAINQLKKGSEGIEFHCAERMRDLKNMSTFLVSIDSTTNDSVDIARENKFGDGAMVEKELVSSLRQSVTKIKEDFISSLFRNGAYDTICKSLEELEKTFSNVNLTLFVTTSWHKIGLGDINFGWGKPIWVGLITGDVDSQMANIVLIDSGSDNIDAWITLSEKEMKVLENNLEFLVFALPNPSIFISSA